jgi:hypothetical protein
VNVIGSGQASPSRRPCRDVPSYSQSQWSEDVVPTVAFNYRKVRKGNVTLKIWDVAGTLVPSQVHLLIADTEILQANRNSVRCGRDIVMVSML